MLTRVTLAVIDTQVICGIRVPVPGVAAGDEPASKVL